MEEELAAVPAWWAEKHEAAVAARAAGAAPPGWVFPPDAFDVTVAPGEDVQAAVDGCPPGGSVLLLPGSHAGPLVLAADQEVHVVGRGEALLWTVEGHALVCKAVRATVDGLLLHAEANGGDEINGVLITAGRLRLQACDVVCTSWECLLIEGGADPTVASCR